MIILGIDPGLQATGFGIIEASTPQLRFLTAGAIQAPRAQPLAWRLAWIHDRLAELIVQHRPDTAVLEKIFTHHHHVTTATLMGHARGVACLVAQAHGLRVEEYPPTYVKKSLTGNGHASKAQVARMIGHWLQHEDDSWSSDATDALALAVVHAHVVAQAHNLPAVVHS